MYRSLPRVLLAVLALPLLGVCLPTQATVASALPDHTWAYRQIAEHESPVSFIPVGKGKKKAKEFEITLRNATIEKYKNRATITTPFQIQRFREHPIDEDGDMHVAGLADEVMLPCVAEIMNFRNVPEAAKLVKKLQKGQETTTLTGVFRLWCEHPDSHGNGPQIQDEEIPDYTDSNPAHVFEIHPVTRIGNIDVLQTLVPIPDEYEARDAEEAFTKYKKLSCRIVPNTEHQTTTIFTSKVGFNYVYFKLRVDEDQHLLTFDTRIVRGSALTLEDKEVATDCRMVFVKNSPPEKAVRSLKKGATLVAMGMPRIDLALVSWRARNGAAKPEVLTRKLPYEMIIVGVYEEQDARLRLRWHPMPSIRNTNVLQNIPFGQVPASIAMPVVGSRSYATTPVIAFSPCAFKASTSVATTPGNARR